MFQINGLRIVDEVKNARTKALSEIQNVLKKDVKTLRDAIRLFDSSKGCSGAVICVGRSHRDGTASPPFRKRLCEYAMQAIVVKLSSGKDSAVKPIPKIDMSVENYLANAVCFTSHVEKEIAVVGGSHHKNCTPFTSQLPCQETLKAHTLLNWSKKNHAAFKMQAQVSGLEKGGDDAADEHSSARKRSRDEFEA